jgi:phage FluMu protein Com
MQEKQLKIALIVSLALTGLLVLGFIIESLGGSDSDNVIEVTRAEDIWMLCDNPDCGAAYKVSKEEFRELMESKGPIMLGPGVMSRLTFLCKECGKETTHRGMKCPKCGKLFVKEYVPGYFADRCPACGYSAREEAGKKRRKQR